MPVPKSKTELIEAIEMSYEKLTKALDDVPFARVDEKSMEGHAKGTMMSVADLVSYLIGWNELVLQWLADDDVGKEVEFPAEGFAWNELGALAQKFYRDYAGLSYEEKRARLDACEAQILLELKRRSDEELYGAIWYRKYTKGKMIQFNTSSPYTNARGRIRKWLRASE